MSGILGAAVIHSAYAWEDVLESCEDTENR